LILALTTRSCQANIFNASGHQTPGAMASIFPYYSTSISTQPSPHPFPEFLFFNRWSLDAYGLVVICSLHFNGAGSSFSFGISGDQGGGLVQINRLRHVAE
jgi:hypothetical protein